ncbi:hypothetical protein COCCADRAFT_111013 [Bipolaris zeicola 26-R-13]|uniref:T6SS Phospholipase effector Tle1-like catalytic domain-containing protein n=1 Tax=Cochliobolus carbonum (strain 26-R-13) TaxID=930089 RepID=W6XQW5_COCC2|nr:uncharacterized protein COCCADRAFT_111013 [Bipolaris zeicola 26-R-13]EUC27695.1 hypothetical protein COCCADRAFT_111013 [Bipolaris zeicola 26-R-13]
MASAPSHRPPKRLAVFCDGTWVGRETTVDDAPPSNIRQLANMVGTVKYKTDDKAGATVHPIQPHKNKNLSETSPASAPDAIVAGYQEGVGLNKNFMQYIWDGATASSISEECISVYKFIVENYTDEHEIWLFGFSRGAFTVRCVAGMINNCGIIKRRADYTEDEVSRLCYEIFRTYRSSLPVDAPKSEECTRWKGLEDRVWQVKRPIRFMGIIDTVGALGIPRLSAGVGFDWSPFEFFDMSISSVVQHCYHAPCLHDRLWIFQPCLVSASEETADDDDEKSRASITQKWFPGTHYDVGRMTFRFVRQSPTNWIEEALGWLPNLLSRTIYPNQVLSDAVLRWMVESVHTVDEHSETPIMPGAQEWIQHLGERLGEAALSASSTEDQHLRTGSGDIYGDVLAYAPGGVVISSVQKTSRSITSLLNGVLPRLGDNIQSVLGVKTLIGILTNTADRRIPGTQAEIYPYTEQERVTVKGSEVVFTVEELARMNEVNDVGQVRYPSQSFQSFLLWKEVFGKKKTSCGH